MMTSIQPIGLVSSYSPPPGDPDGARVAGRAWTYDSAVTAAADAATGETGRAGALLDQLAALQRADGGFAQSFDLATGRPDGPPRAGNVAWVGLAAVADGAPRHAALIDGVVRWLRARQVDWHGLVRGGEDVRWASAEHNLEARALLAALGEPVDVLDAAIEQHLLVREADGGVWLRQGFEDQARPCDVQALGILWLLARGQVADARAVAASAAATLRADGRTVDWPGAAGQTFSGYRPYADAWGPDVLWMEGTLQLRLARARLGDDLAQLDDAVDRWAALTPPGLLLHADRAAGDYHVWPAAGPAAWLRLSRSGFALL